MKILLIKDEGELPEYKGVRLDNLDDAEDLSVLCDEDFVSLIQHDGNGENEHWVLVQKHKVKDLIAILQGTIE